MTWSSSNRPCLPAARALLCASAMGLTAALGPGAVRAADLRLDLPVRCDMARDCSIQKYVDRAPTTQRLDYHCGALTTDGHDGTDFRLRRFRDFGLGIKVVAAAAGTVLRVRDGMADISVRDAAAPALGGRLAGNAVVIGHGEGWETQYSHLNRGSVRVRPGDKIAAGAVLGVLGMSGNAEFPHLHFEVRRGGQTVDPFAPASRAGCGKDGPTLWSAAALAALPYRGGEVLAAGLVPTVTQARVAYRELTMPPPLNNPDHLILWGSASGVQSGDVQNFRILDPKGGVILSRAMRISNSRLHWVGYAGLRRPVNGWVPGRYRGTYSLVRRGNVVGKSSMILRLLGEPSSLN